MRGADRNLGLEEIIVTATKRKEKLQDVPVAVSALTTEDIAARGFTQYADYLNTVPGVYFQDSGPGMSQIRIRGLSTTEGGSASTVSTYSGEAITSVVTIAGGKPNLRLVDIEPTGFVKGERLPGSFEKNGSVGLQYDFALGGEWSGFARADYVYTGDVRIKFGRGEGAIFVTQDPQSIGNLRLGLQRDSLGIELHGRNITDERGVTSTDDPDMGGTQVLIRPREIGIELRYSLH